MSDTNELIKLDNHVRPERPLRVSLNHDLTVLFDISRLGSGAGAVATITLQDALTLCNWIRDRREEYADTDHDHDAIVTEPSGRTSDDAILAVTARLANEHNWDLDELAGRAGMPRELLRRMYDGDVKVNLDDMDRFAAAFGVDFFDFTRMCDTELKGR